MTAATVNNEIGDVDGLQLVTAWTIFVFLVIIACYLVVLVLAALPIHRPVRWHNGRWVPQDDRHLLPPADRQDVVQPVEHAPGKHLAEPPTDPQEPTR